MEEENLFMRCTEYICIQIPPGFLMTTLIIVSIFTLVRGQTLTEISSNFASPRQ